MPMTSVRFDNAQMTALVYELLDAHDDTASLAADLEGDQHWQVHLAYLRALQRTGREALANICPEELA